MDSVKHEVCLVGSIKHEGVFSCESLNGVLTDSVNMKGALVCMTDAFSPNNMMGFSQWCTDEFSPVQRHDVCWREFSQALRVH